MAYANTSAVTRRQLDGVYGRYLWPRLSLSRGRVVNREGFGDPQRDGSGVRKSDVRRHGDDELPLAKGHERRRPAKEVPFSVMASHPGGFASKGNCLECPAETVVGVIA